MGVQPPEKFPFCPTFSHDLAASFPCPSRAAGQPQSRAEKRVAGQHELGRRDAAVVIRHVRGVASRTKNGPGTRDRTRRLPQEADGSHRRAEDNRLPLGRGARLLAASRIDLGPRQHTRSSPCESEQQDQGGHHPSDCRKNNNKDRNKIHVRHSHMRSEWIVTRVARHYSSVRAIVPLHRK